MAKPVKLPEWATDASRTVEPSSGEKGTGWVANTRPPARKMNWLFNIIYTWFLWLDDHLGGTAPDFTVQGADIGAGSNLSGGDLALSGGQATGNGGSDITISVVEANQGAGTTTRNPTQVGEFSKTTLRFEYDYGIKVVGGTSYVGIDATGGTGNAGVKGTGGSAGQYGVEGYGVTSGSGVYGQGGASGDGLGGEFVGGATNGSGVKGLASGTGDGVYGQSSSGEGVWGYASTTGIGVRGVSEQGYGVVAQGDTTTPGKSAFRIVPQNAAPTGPNAVGDIYVTSAGIPYICTSAGSPGTWTKISAT